MKHKILTIFFIFLSLLTLAQDRVNRQKLKFIDSSFQLTSSIGWSYNHTIGEWIDYKNVICEDKKWKETWSNLQGSYMMSKNNEQNFISIQTKVLIYKDIRYYVILVEKWNGNYEYKEIMYNWREFKTMYGYIFEETEYNKLKNIKTNLDLKTQLTVELGSYYEEYEETLFLDLIQNELNYPKYVHNTTYIFPIRKMENEDVRFYVPYEKNEYSNKYFEDEYFETSFSNFSKFIIN
jgi:hypothetical protein